MDGQEFKAIMFLSMVVIIAGFGFMASIVAFIGSML